MDLAVKIDDYRAWFSKQRNADAKRMAFAALGTFEKLNGKTDVSRKQLIPIVNAPVCRFTAVWMMGADLLFRVGANNKEARDAVLMDLLKIPYKDPYFGLKDLLMPGTK